MYNRERRQKQAPKPIEIGTKRRGNIKKISDILVDIFLKVRIIPYCMDKKKDCTIPQCGVLPDLTKERIVVGTKQLKKAVKAGRVKYVFLAENADPAVTEPLEELCTANHIQITWVRSMAELGRACGIEVGAAAAAVLTS